MNSIVYYVISAVLSAVILYGIFRMSQVKTAVRGNQLSGLATAIAIVITLIYFDIISAPIALAIVLVSLAIGGLIGLYLTKAVKMIQMPQMVGMLNGVGGAASALVGGATIFFSVSTFSLATAVLALCVGTFTFTGSFIAAAKLAGVISGRPVIWRGHQTISLIASILMLLSLVLAFVPGVPAWLVVVLATVFSAFWGIAISIRVGGADMPITISLLNSFSGVAGSIAGMAIGDILLVAVGGIVGASGLLLTQIMCRAMNSSLMDILLGKTSVPTTKKGKGEQAAQATPAAKKPVSFNPTEVLNKAKKVIIVPGYGMAIAQAQHLVKELASTLEAKGAEVKYAIHPVAGRMPGHMNVLLSEADVSYEQLFEMEEINDEFATCDACIVIGANDVMNPAARDTEDTPISGMPILNVDQAPHILIFNYDLKPGYAGVENPVYSRTEGVSLLLGNAADTLQELLKGLKGQAAQPTLDSAESGAAGVLNKAKKVIIVPGYGMAIAQAQHLVKELADALEAKGAEVKYAIHPVAGRMPGHMNVLLSEADVSYEQLFEMEEINDEFATCDACIVIGANDVMNPAARDTEDTPISGMPILNVDQAPHILIFNYDLKPGYAGVENPIYSRAEGVSLLLGNAADTLRQLLNALKGQAAQPTQDSAESGAAGVLNQAKKVIIVPGYGMAIAQAQHLVKELADALEAKGAEVKYAIHPVAGRMPGHMNVLLSEADVSYEQLFEMEEINDEFATCDACIVIGANDVMNPAARDTEDTPISGMPILNVDQAPHILIFNYDLKPGYAGVENPIYSRTEGVSLLLGNAADTLRQLLDQLK